MNPELAETLGRIVDGLENALYGTRLTLSAELHTVGTKRAMREARDKLATIIRDSTGEDPWKDNPLDG